MSNSRLQLSRLAPVIAALGNGYDLLVPDLSGAAGFDTGWMLHPGSVLQWTAIRVGGTLGLGAGAVPGDGATRRTAFASGLIPRS
jgi:hypothetical protein